MRLLVRLQVRLNSLTQVRLNSLTFQSRNRPKRAPLVRLLVRLLVRPVDVKLLVAYEC